MLENEDKVWKIFISRHWKMFALFIAIVIIAIIGAIYVFLWFVGEAQMSGLVPTTLNLWTMNYLVTFILHVIFWEIIFILIPVLIVIILIWQLWWKRLPDLERQEYKRGHLFFGSRSRTTDGGGAISLFINIVFIIKVLYDGKWNEPFAQWSFDYLVYSYLWALIWVLIIIGIPIAIGGIWWIRHEMKKGS